MKKFSHGTKLKFAKAFLNYWWVKEKAVSFKRLKTCRRLKVMDLTTMSSPDNEFEISDRLEKIRNTTLKEHYNNLRHIVMEDAVLNDSKRVRNVEADPRRGRIRLSFTREQNIKNYVIRVLETASNLPMDQVRPHLIFGDGPSSFSFSYTGSRRYFREGSHLEGDYEAIVDWIRRVKNTFLLIDRVADKMPDQERLYGYEYRSTRAGAKIEFTGISEDSCSIEDILKSAFTATGPDGKVRKHRGTKVEDVAQVTPAQTRQQILDNYVTNVIIPSRGQA